MEMERRKGVECCWCGSTPVAKGDCTDLWVCITSVHQRGSFVHELSVWGPIFSTIILIPFSFGEQSPFESKSVSTNLEQYWFQTL
jgi:hypothetical protein